MKVSVSVNEFPRFTIYFLTHTAMSVTTLKQEPVYVDEPRVLCVTAPTLEVAISDDIKAEHCDDMETVKQEPVDEIVDDDTDHGVEMV